MLKFKDRIAICCFFITIALSVQAKTFTSRGHLKTEFQGANIEGVLSAYYVNTNDSGWKFTAGQTTYVGSIDSVALNREKNAISFWGHANSSRTIKFSLVAFFDSASFNTNQQNVSTRQATLIYGRLSGAPNDMLSSDPTKRELLITIDDYNNQTGALIGRISGKVNDGSGQAVEITNGQFHAKL